MLVVLRHGEQENVGCVPFAGGEAIVTDGGGTLATDRKYCQPYNTNTHHREAAVKIISPRRSYFSKAKTVNADTL